MKCFPSAYIPEMCGTAMLVPMAGVVLSAESRMDIVYIGLMASPPGAAMVNPLLL